MKRDESTTGPAWDRRAGIRALAPGSEISRGVLGSWGIRGGLAVFLTVITVFVADRNKV